MKIEHERCHWTSLSRYSYAQTMRTATLDTTTRNLFRARRSVFGDYPEVPFNALTDIPETLDERMAAD